MAEVKISNLPVATNAGMSTADLLATVSGGATKALSLAVFVSALYGNAIDRYVIVPFATTDALRGANTIAAYAQAAALTPGGVALSNENRAIVLLPPGRYAFTPTTSANALVVNTNYVDFQNITGDRNSVIFYMSADKANPTTLKTMFSQTALDARFIDITFVDIADYTGSNWETAADLTFARTFEQVSLQIGSTVTTAKLQWVNIVDNGDDTFSTATQTAIPSAQDLQRDLFLKVGVTSGNPWTGVHVGDKVTVYWGSTIVQAYPVVNGSLETATAFNGALPNSAVSASSPNYNILYLRAPKTPGQSPVGTTNTVVTVKVHRTQAPSVYTRCRFIHVDKQWNLIVRDWQNESEGQHGLDGTPWAVVHMDGTWIDCDAYSGYSWRVGASGSLAGHMFGTYIRCRAHNFSFVGDGDPTGNPGDNFGAFGFLSATMRECVGGDFCYASCTAFGSMTTWDAVIDECIGGDGCGSLGRECAGTILGGSYGQCCWGAAGGNGNWNAVDAIPLGYYATAVFSGLGDGVTTDGNDSFGRGCGAQSGGPDRTIDDFSTCTGIVRNCTFLHRKGKPSPRIGDPYANGKNYLADPAQQTGFVHTSDATPAFAAGFSLSANSTYYIGARVVARNTSTGASAIFTLAAKYKVTGQTGGTAAVSNASTTALGSDFSTATAALVLDSDNRAKVQVTGEAATGIDWLVESYDIQNV